MQRESSEMRASASPCYRSRKYAMLNRPIEVDRHLERVRRYLRPRWDDRVLEIGCSRGFLTKRVREELAPSTTGVDLNPEAIANACVDGLSVMDAQALAYEDESFDKLYSFHCIEHIPDLHGALREMNRVLKPGGRILLVYPAEPIRGLYVVPTALILFGNALRAREIHLHKLWPAKIERMLTATSLDVTASALDLLLTPQFITVLEKGSRSGKVAVSQTRSGTDHQRARQPVPALERATNCAAAASVGAYVDFGGLGFVRALPRDESANGLHRVLQQGHIRRRQRTE